MTATYDCIATTTLGSDTASTEFTSISGSFTDLVLVVGTVASDTSNADGLVLRVGNGTIDTGSNYSRTNLIGNGSSALSYRATSASRIVLTQDAYLPITLGQVNAIVNFQNYSNTTTYKTVLHRLSYASGDVIAQVGLWRSTSAINRIQIYSNGYNLKAGSTFTLYGIKAE
jgi:hypothetical protein